MLIMAKGKMNKKVYQVGIGKLCLTFNIEMDELRSKLYFTHLRDLPNEDFEKAVKTLIERNKFFPAISEIRELCIDQGKDIVDAWNEFAEQSYSWDNPETPRYKNKLLYECLRFLGGVRAIAEVKTGDKKFLRKDFIEIYRILKREQDFDQIQLPAPVEKEKIGERK